MEEQNSNKTKVENIAEDNKYSAPTETEINALAQSGPLLRFASENIPKLDPDLSLAIAEAIDAHQKNHWYPETSQRFWGAYNALCEQIKPVTMDCLTASSKNIPRQRFFKFWEKPIIESLAEKNSRYYLNLLGVLLGITIQMQLLVWAYSYLSNELDQRVTTINVNSSTLSTECQQARAELAKLQEKEFSPDNATETSLLITKISSSIDELERESSKVVKFAEILNQISLKREDIDADVSSIRDYKKDFNSECTRIINFSTHNMGLVTKIMQQAKLFSAILIQFILPIFLGMIGALAFVLRNSSEQIRNTTFSTTTPIRNWVRVMLGALMGVVVGLFGELSSQISLPPLAMAFLAGYGVEGVFSVFDGFIDKLRPENTK